MVGKTFLFVCFNCLCFPQSFFSPKWSDKLFLMHFSKVKQSVKTCKEIDGRNACERQDPCPHKQEWKKELNIGKIGQGQGSPQHYTVHSEEAAKYNAIWNKLREPHDLMPISSSWPQCSAAGCKWRIFRSFPPVWVLGVWAGC